MSELPRNFEQTIAQLTTALAAATAAGRRRVQIDIKVPGIEVTTLLQALAPTLGSGWVALFPDAGAAALARRQLGDAVGYDLRGLGEMRTGIDRYSALILVEPSAVEVETVEALANQATDKLVVLLNSRMEEVGVVGIGLTGRRLRERFLTTVETIYTVQPTDEGAIFRCWPDPWQLWREGQDGEYTLINESDNKPSGEEIDLAFKPQGEGWLDGLRRFLRALGN